MTAFLASQVFRLLLVPLAIASLGCFIRYFTKKLRRHKISAEVFIVWPELIIAALFNLLILISDTAEESKPPTNRLLSLFAASLLTLLLLWVVSFVAALPRKTRRRLVVWTYGLPHLLALSALEVSLLLAHAPKAG